MISKGILRQQAIILKHQKSQSCAKYLARRSRHVVSTVVSIEQINYSDFIIHESYRLYRVINIKNWITNHTFTTILVLASKTCKGKSNSFPSTLSQVILSLRTAQQTTVRGVGSSQHNSTSRPWHRCRLCPCI